jgi:hypothetical protein
MAVPLPVTVVPPNTCLIRAASVADEKTTKRFFAFYGTGRNMESYSESKAFIRPYASKSGKYEYHKVLKPIILLDLPYLNLLEFTPKEATKGVIIGYRLMDYLRQHEASAVVKQFGLSMICQLVFQAIGLTFVEDNELEPDMAKCMDKMRSWMGTMQVFPNNPDYGLARVVCELGLAGWLRRGTERRHTAPDEVFLCDIDKTAEDGYIAERADCNLDDLLIKFQKKKRPNASQSRSRSRSR